MRANEVDVIELAIGGEDAWCCVIGFGDDFTSWVDDQRGPPKFKALFHTYAVRGAEPKAVADCVGSERYTPSIVLAGTVLILFFVDPTDCRRVKKDLGASQCEQTRCFGEPLVPANPDAQFGVLGFDGCEAQVARSEVELLVEEWVIRNVHLSIRSGDRAVGVEDNGRVVVQSRSSLFKNGYDDDNAVFGRKL